MPLKRLRPEVTGAQVLLVGGAGLPVEGLVSIAVRFDSAAVHPHHNGRAGRRDDEF